MSFIRNGETRTYIEGKSDSYIYPTGPVDGNPSTDEVVVRWNHGTIPADDFWEVVCRAVARVDGPEDAEAFAERVQEHRREMARKRDKNRLRQISEFVDDE